MTAFWVGLGMGLTVWVATFTAWSDWDNGLRPLDRW